MVTPEEISLHIENGLGKDAAGLVRGALEADVNPYKILEAGLVKGLRSLERKFRRNEIFLPQVLIAVREVEKGMEVLRTRISPLVHRGRAVLGAVYGDEYDIENVVIALLLEKSGIRGVHLGANIELERFIRGVEEERANLLFCSVGRIHNQYQVKLLVKSLDKAGLRGRTGVIARGEGMSAAKALAAGADGYAQGAVKGVDLAAKLLEKYPFPPQAH
jgi:5-methyltetrahydrofolate--homocysteine methyltransferase